MPPKKSMRAVVFKGVGKVSIEQRPIPSIQDPRDVIVKVTVAALCGSDLHWYRGHQDIPVDFVPGHEFVGVVHEVGSAAKEFKIGDTVVATFSTQCGDCFYCKRNQTSRCPEGILFGNSVGNSVDGGQAEFVRVPHAPTTLTLAPSNIQENLLVLMADIFPTGYFCASRFLKSLPSTEASSTVSAVVGCGPVGICAITAALTWCDTVFAIDLVPERLAEAERLGAKPLLLNENVVAAIKAATDGRGADVALEVVGTPEALLLCVGLVRPFGCISSVGLQTKDLVLHGPTLYAKNITISWGRCPVRGVFQEALDCLAKVQDKIAFLCAHHMRLDEAQEAYDLFATRKVHKVLLEP